MQIFTLVLTGNYVFNFWGSGTGDGAGRSPYFVQSSLQLRFTQTHCCFFPPSPWTQAFLLVYCILSIRSIHTTSSRLHSRSSSSISMNLDFGETESYSPLRSFCGLIILFYFFEISVRTGRQYNEVVQNVAFCILILSFFYFFVCTAIYAQAEYVLNRFSMQLLFF